jgi:polyhydroxybutyrate depolymerase
VLAFHGRFGDGEDQAELSHLDKVADEFSFVAVYPDGVGRSWNAGSGAGFAERRGIDDVAFVSALIDRVSRQVRIDRMRVYATGMSNGGNFVHRLGCELPDRIAAIAAVAGTIASEVARDCDPERPITVLHVHGSDDPFNPYEGGQTKGGGQVESVRETAAGWVRRDGCGGSGVTTRLTRDATRTSWTACPAGTEVALVRVEGGGHAWPGGSQYLPPEVVGETTQTFDASELIWKFFSRHEVEAASDREGTRVCASC